MQMPLLKRVRVLAAKIETTSGTAESLSASDAAFNAYDVSIQPNLEFQPRDLQGSLSQMSGTLGARGGTCTFKIDLTGDGAAGTPAWASTFFPACAMVVSTGTFSPKSESPGSNVKTITIGVYENGLVKKLRGAAGTFKIMFEAGKKIYLEFTFTGAWVAPADATILAPTYPTVMPIRFAGATWTIGSYTPKVEKMEIDIGNTVYLRPTGTDASGYVAAIVDNRRVVGTLDPESDLVATRDQYGVWLAGTEAAFSLAVTDGTDTITFAAPKFQITNVQEGERSNLQIDTVSFQCNRSAAIGNDELTIDFS